MSDYYEPYAEYWRGLAGTTGEITPRSETIDKWLQELVDIGSTTPKRLKKRKKKLKRKRVKFIDPALKNVYTIKHVYNLKQ